MIRSLIVDDHQIVSDGIQRILEMDHRIKVVGKATTIAEARTLCESLSPDIILLDLRLPDSRGPSEIPSLKRLCPNAKILVLTGYGSSARSESIRLGADEFLTKELASEVITQTVLSLFPQYAGSNGLGQLSEREQELAALVAQGLSNDEIAQKLSISRNTVKTHVANIFDKMGVRDRIELVLRWRERPSR